MDAALLEDIKGAGYWRVNLRPLSVLGEKLSIQKCRDTVSASSVQLRGWDYPHIQHGNDQYGGVENGDGFFESWTSFLNHREFWRMYQSGQFLHYASMWEDRDDSVDTARPFLSIVGTIYLFTEIVEFTSRLANGLQFKDGFAISIEAHHTRTRRLWVGPNRMPFFAPKTTAAENVAVNAKMTVDGAQSSQQVALAMCKEFFDRFGWNPADDQIQADQIRLLKQQF
ncbi:hypothetical protein FJV80_04290 [Mesorhizobium sp. WSM4310]|uniref:hypothetical protein n=1 Tax=Mesorhizobium sp. WSM4310 TaxID=2589883 RepID=UPI00115F4C4C|nr:hypothetical protein [Mesorhizobium sp. WSM4310]TRC91147.1 hypothetical protein FJV80_04290 [Mesorhizobium sp. WSM4310]